jgi:cyclohexanecarboxylate-CoA ligase
MNEELIAAYGEFVWEASNNVQVRCGDPVRRLDFAALESAPQGLTDQQIADRLGLRREQVTQVRVTLEARRYDRQRHLRLHELGGTQRFRAEREAQPPERCSENALALRQALRFRPQDVKRYVQAGWWAGDTLTGWLERAAGGRYGELRKRSLAFAGGLRHLGIRAGDVVVVQLPNTPEFLVAYLAIARLGAVLCTAHMPYRAAELRSLIAHARARAFIGLGRYKDFAPSAEVQGLRNDLPALEHVIALGEPVAGALDFSALERSPPLGAAVAPPVAADPFLLLFTSGTTSSPKAVPLPYQVTLGNARLAAAQMRLSAEDVVLCAAPFTHLFGLFSVHLALCAGASNLLHVASTPAELVAAIERDRPSVLFTAPAHLAAMASLGLLQAADFSSLRRVVVSGSAVPPELARLVAAKLPPGAFTQLWGMTELQAGVYTRPDDPLEIAAASAGRPGPGTEVRTCDAADVPVAAGEEGELQVRGALLFPGYFMNEAANRSAFTHDGWFRTGDLALIDARGCVRITGRVGEFINRGGVKYHPGDVESLLATHPNIAQAAIVPCPDPILGEKACCFVVPQGAKGPTLEEICSFLLERGIAKLKLPERLELIDEMPMTPTRKVIKGKLRERLTRQR